MSLPVAIRNFLLADPTLGPLVDNWKVFSDRPPQDAKTPFVVFWVVSEESNDCLDSSPDTAIARVQFDCVDDTRQGSSDLRVVVKQRLAGARVNQDGVYLRINQSTGQIYATDRPSSGSDQYRFITMQDFEIAHNDT